MAKKLSEAEWAKVRYDRENNGLSFHELADKYKVSSATVYRKSKADHWKVPELDPDQGNETKNETDSETVKPVKSKGIKPDCLSENETKQPKRNETKRNETQNETAQDSKSFDVQSYVDSLKSNFDPSRARDQKFIGYQLEQIDQHLGGLVDVIGVDSGHETLGNASKYNPAFARVAYNIALLGGTPKSLAEILNVSEQTVYNWLKTHNDFHIAWYGGKDFADANVVQALYKRAVGWREEVEESRTDKDGNVLTAEKVLVFAPDVQAQMFWLKNRQPLSWKDKVEVQEEIQVAVIDKAAAEERYTRVLNKAADLKASLGGRAERMGLILDGESEELD